MCKRFYVSGKVQGVWYRAHTQEQAEELNLTGYAKNLPDGRVEVVACGDEINLKALEAWLWEGSPAAMVSDVVVEAMEHQQFIDFQTC